MRANLIGLAILIAVTSAAFLRAEPARCENCLSGQSCWTDGICGSGCDCLMINGLGHAGVCG